MQINAKQSFNAQIKMARELKEKTNNAHSTLIQTSYKVRTQVMIFSKKVAKLKNCFAIKNKP